MSLLPASQMPSMRYRRFGRTQLQMPVITCGGMRYQQAWGDLDPDKIEREGQANLEATINRAFELGINHIETARGYGSSEMQLGWVLPSLPREKLIVQTKIGPQEAASFLSTFETSLRYLQLDYVDLLAFHGINTTELLDMVLAPGGPMEAARQLQKQGRARWIGFSTHGPTDVITQACATGAFDYINLHWYFVNELNWPAIQEAERQDMGVFIISPVDKGGMLQKPSEKMCDLCAPLLPMQFNDLWCLARPQVHTLSIGADKPSDFDNHVNALKHYDAIDETIAPIEARIRQEMARVCGQEWAQSWSVGLPEHHQTPNGVNLREILRLWTYAKTLDLTEWAKGRYNLMKSNNDDHWTPGSKASDISDAQLRSLIETSPVAARIPDVVREAHEMLDAEQVKRLSQSE